MRNSLVLTFFCSLGWLTFAGCGPDANLHGYWPGSTPQQATASENKASGSEPAARSPERSFSDLEKDPALQTHIKYIDLQSSYRVGQYIEFGVEFSGIVGSGFDRFSVRPILPRGLALDSQTGKIVGAPQETAPLRTYQITGYNGRVSDTTELTFEITE